MAILSFFPWILKKSKLFRQFFIHKPSVGSSEAPQKFGPERFGPFDVYRLQTKKKQTRKDMY